MHTYRHTHTANTHEYTDKITQVLVLKTTVLYLLPHPHKTFREIRLPGVSLTMIMTYLCLQNYENDISSFTSEHKDEEEVSVQLLFVLFFSEKFCVS
jgi:hypothetical protein